MNFDYHDFFGKVCFNLIKLLSFLFYLFFLSSIVFYFFSVSDFFCFYRCPDNSPQKKIAPPRLGLGFGLALGLGLGLGENFHWGQLS